MKKFLRKIFFFSILYSLPAICFSQSYWNEWVNYNQKYYKIPVDSNGIYRIDSLTLTHAGISLSGLDRATSNFFSGDKSNTFI